MTVTSLTSHGVVLDTSTTYHLPYHLTRTLWSSLAGSLDAHHDRLVGASGDKLGAIRRPGAAVDSALMTLELTNLGGRGCIVDKGFGVRSSAAEFRAIGRVPVVCGCEDLYPAILRV